MKHKWLRVSSLLVSFILAFLFTGCVNSGSGSNDGTGMEISDFEVKNYTSGEKFVFFADLPPAVNGRDIDIYKEAGFTDYILIPRSSYAAEFTRGTENPDGTQFANALTLLNQKGLGAYVRGFGTKESLDLFENLDFSKYDAYRGFYIVDEPSGDNFDSIAETVVPYWNEHYAKDGFWHLNLYPSYSGSSLKVETKDGESIYEAYINQYVEKIINNVQGEKGIGMDHYMLRVRGGNYYISDMFLYDLMVVAQAAKSTGATLHNCIQTSTGHTSTRTLTFSSELRWQYYVSMAFGAQIFEAFAYSDDSSLKFDCMYGGEPHDLYYFQKEVTTELKKFEDVFLAFDWEGVKTYVGSETELGYNPAFDAIKAKEMNALYNVKSFSATQDTLVGQFDCEGDKAYILVNYSEPYDAKMDTVKMQFDNCDKVVVYRGGRMIKYKLTNGTLTLPLIGGEGVFVIPVID